MDIGGPLGSMYDPAIQAQQRADAGREERRQLLEEIRENGFRNYVDDLKKEKIEALRREILEAMGLSEDDLAKMSAEQRSAIEKAISEEIQRRLAASSLMDSEAGNAVTSRQGSTGSAFRETSDGDPMKAGPLAGFARFDTAILEVLDETEKHSPFIADREGIADRDG